MNVALLVLCPWPCRSKTTSFSNDRRDGHTRAGAGRRGCVAVTVLRGADSVTGHSHAAEALETVPGGARRRDGQLRRADIAVHAGAARATTPRFWLTACRLNSGRLHRPGAPDDRQRRSHRDVRGPVSVLYGSDAVTGVGQIFTRTGRDRTIGCRGARGHIRLGGWGSRCRGVERQDRLAARVSRFLSGRLYHYNNRYRTAWRARASR